MRNGEPRVVEQRSWTDDQTERLADLIADGFSFEAAGAELGRTKNSCISRFRQAIARPFGWQAA